jgi:hypothetical protein
MYKRKAMEKMTALEITSKFYFTSGNRKVGRDEQIQQLSFDMYECILHVWYDTACGAVMTGYYLVQGEI